MEQEIADKVVIVTTTSYNPDTEEGRLRANLTQRTMQAARDKEYPVVVVDFGSSDEFLRELERFGADVHTQQTKGMGGSRREAIAYGQITQKPIIAWMEPEKVGYIPELWKTVTPILDNRLELVVPTRRSLNSYPIIQQYCEEAGNFFFGNLTGKHLDMWSGPRTFAKDIGDYFVDYDGGFGDQWESIFIPVIAAIIDGRRVGGVEIDYTHPAEQTRLESGNIDLDLKRVEQLNALTHNMAQYWQEHKK